MGHALVLCEAWLGPACPVQQCCCRAALLLHRANSSELSATGYKLRTETAGACRCTYAQTQANSVWTFFTPQ